ncbi:MAG: hypothetical protein K1X29_02550 [Bdellovibrionales bacterium]|nr:hypothetical protein [Bdellovibrionales bacterium]
MKLLFVLISFFVILVGILFVMLIFPILCLFKLVDNKKISSKEKKYFTLGILFVWPLGAGIYALKYPEKKWDLFWGYFTVFISILVLVLLVWHLKSCSKILCQLPLTTEFLCRHCQPTL